MSEDQVKANLKAMDELDFVGWNNADWHGVFAKYHTDDVFVDWKGQEPTRGIEEHIDAMKAFVESVGARLPRSFLTRSALGPTSGPAPSGSSRTAVAW